MKFSLFVLLFGLYTLVARAEPNLVHFDGNYLSIFDLPREKRAESFDALLSSDVPSRAAAEKLASEYWFQHHGRLAEEGLVVAGLYRIGRDIEGFASRGDWVWEVRVLHLAGELDGVVWINARSKKIQAFGPTKQ